VLRVQLERKLVQALGRRRRAELQHEIPVIVLALRVGWQRGWEWAAVGNGPGKRRRAGAGERGGNECGHPHTKERGKGQQAAGKPPARTHPPGVVVSTPPASKQASLLQALVRSRNAFKSPGTPLSMRYAMLE
jgi:hypothetical protein